MKVSLKKLNWVFAIIIVMICFNVATVLFSAGELSAEQQDIVVNVPDEVNIVDTSVEVPDFDNAIDCYLFAESLMMSSTGLSSTITGSVKSYKSFFGKDVLVLNQSMNNARYTDNDGIKYSTSSSEKGSGMMLGKNTYQRLCLDTRTEDGLLYRQITQDESSYTADKFETFTKDEYIDLTGSLPGGSIYLVRESTINNIEYFNKTSEGYEFKFKLDNRKATSNYRKLVKLNAGSDGYPTMKSVSITCKVDLDGKFKSYITEDEYTINMFGINARCVSYYDEEFSCIGGDVKRPFDINL